MLRKRNLTVTGIIVNFLHEQSLFLKKPIAIVFLSSFLLFHYDRLLNYFRCQLPQITTAQTVKCACQAQSPDLSGNDKPPAEERQPLKQRPEEVFARNLFSILPHGATDPLLSTCCARDPALSPGFAVTIFQPPRS